MKNETYQGSILSPDELDDLKSVTNDEATSDLQEIRKCTEENNRLLNQIEQHTMIMTIIMVISVICSAVSVVSALITVFNFSSLLG